MIPTDLAIIGGGPAAMACARAYRAAGGDGDVVLIADEGRMPYRRPPLTKELLSGLITEAELPLEDDGWPAAHGVRFLAQAATGLDPRPRRIDLDDGRAVHYDHCLLATGSIPSRLPVPGAEDPAVLVVRTLAHVRDLLSRLEDAGERVTVIGSGFVGCEIAASLRRRGHPVTLVADETLPQAARLGEEVGEHLRRWLATDGVDLLLGAPVDRIVRAGATLRVQAGAADADARVVVMAAGARPRSSLARIAAVDLHEGAVPVDALMRTVSPGLLAAGDVAHAEHVVAGRSLRVEHWGDALAQGEIAGRTAAGDLDDPGEGWDAVPGFWSTIGGRTLKHAAWGDGHDAVDVTDHEGGGFTARYSRGGRLVGVLTHQQDGDYEAGMEQIARDAV